MVVTEISAGRDVVIVAHSYGGIVGGSVIKGLAAGQSGRSSSMCLPATGSMSTTSGGCVSALVLIASGFSMTGVSFMAPFLNRPPPAWRINKQTGYAQLVVDPQMLFYHDVPLDESRQHVARLTDQSLKSLFEGGEYVFSGWRDVPVWYIGTAQDRGLPVLAQRMLVGMARALGGRVAHRELDSSHSPFLSQPSEVVVIILEAVTNSALHAPEGQARIQPAQACACHNKRITFPAVQLFSPTTWFRYGAPLAVGYLIGWGVRIYNLLLPGRSKVA